MLHTLISLSAPAVATRPVGWKSADNTGSLPCHSIWRVFTFMLSQTLAVNAMCTEVLPSDSERLFLVRLCYDRLATGVASMNDTILGADGSRRSRARFSFPPRLSSAMQHKRLPLIWAFKFNDERECDVEDHHPRHHVMSFHSWLLFKRSHHVLTGNPR